MLFSKTILLSILSALTTKALAGCSYEGGNYYCSEVSAITYENVGYSGTYQDVTSMDESSCKCTQQSTSFSGTNAPLDEELSVHFRGPVKLLQFGVYYPSSSSSNKVKRDAEPCAEVRHIHHAHKREAATEVVQVTQTVYVDANGSLVTGTASGSPSTAGSGSQSTAGSGSSSTAAGNSPAGSPTTLVSSVKTSSATSTTNAGSTSTQSSSSASSSQTGGSSGSDYNRASYFTPGSADNCVFMNTKGADSVSGTWSSCFGNSISYVAEDGVSVASNATAIGEVTLSSDEEYMIFSGETCDQANSQGTECGYYRNGIPAYHGFGGSEKIFVFEFEMPTDSSSSGASNPDMPAIWLLNAKIPRTLQYGDASCSCWKTGCGELDLFEILSEGDSRLISHLHDGQGDDGTSTGGGGSQDYFKRPTSGSFKGAVIFNSDKTINIVQLDDSTDFSSGLSSETVQSWKSISGSTASISS